MATMYTGACEQLSEYEANFDERIRCFEESAPKYSGNVLVVQRPLQLLNSVPV